MTGTGNWTAQMDGLAISYSIAVLKEIHARVVEGFLSVPRGGIEVGGVLFGVTDSSGVSIEAHRDLPIDYLNGPSFVLAPSDESKLQRLLEESVTDPELQGLTPVGWYHSHTRSDIRMRETDIELHNRYFPDRAQVALVVKPFKFEPAQFGLFYRNGAGEMVSGSTFTLPEPVRGERPADTPAPAPVLMPDAAPVEAPHAPPHRSRRKATWIPVALAMIAAAVILFLRFNPSPSESFGLRVSNSGDQVTVEWDPSSPAIRNATYAELRILDGGKQTQTLQLFPDHLRNGRVTYVRKTGQVEVRMRLRGTDAVPERTAYFIGPDPPAPAAQAPPPAAPKEEPPPEPSPELLRMKKELEELRARLKAPVKPLPPPPRQPQSTPVRAAQPAQREASPPPVTAATRPEPQPSAPPVVQPPKETTQVAEVKPATLPPEPQSGIRNRENRITPPPQQPPADTPGRPLIQRTGPAKPRSGRAIWTGELRKGDVLVIDGGRPSGGTLTGSWFDGPARIRVHPAALADGGLVVYSSDARLRDQSRVESPSPRNGWNVTTYQFDDRRARGIGVAEPPGAHNGWKRVVLRNTGRTTSVLIFEWDSLQE